MLEKLYGHVLIPEAVIAELGAVGANADEFKLIQGIHWIETRAVSNRPLISSLTLELDIGEAEAIALAMETKSDLLLID